MIHVFQTPEELAAACAAAIASYGTSTIANRGVCNLSLAGGNTPRSVHHQLATLDMDWSKVHIFWSDERCVPPDHEDSNYRMAQESLLDRVSIPVTNIHRMRGELEPAQAAAAYRTELDDHFGEGSIPRFDLILLGLGEDGHTASLFPGTDALKRDDELVVETYVQSKGSWRLTFTLPLINSAQKVYFLVTDTRKASVVKDVIEGENSSLPASAVRPTSGQLDWYLDQAAASALSQNP